MSPSSQRVWIEISVFLGNPATVTESPSSQRVWIEMDLLTVYNEETKTSPSSQRVWIEISILPSLSKFLLSPSSQRVWIEITNFLNVLLKKDGRPLHRGCGLK